ncbi:class I SAM-dependent methyltransferase [Bizionia argentinensis JUB59]|uniref:Class I SAM-dependent methyltransferase n=1 Tax=Bizionia argentinensis JUB59 TaxID=1046627 RepID=G2EAS0_9FLAO|nr:class I SAM-dependent methyltransferase [Bizionia argentinensis]EGV44393.1 class I SAM-dependent methyltransferase [Bizionia argentinensis JUB59]
MSSKFTGERLETSICNGNTINHLHRYAISMALIKEKTVLDIASGEGYGSHLMSLDASFVYGVDIDAETIERAKIKYNRGNLKFLHGSTSKIPLENNSVDVVISFETIEHHNEHEEMLTEIKRVLRPEGTLLISSPDKHFYSDLRKYTNPFHIKELYKDEFIDLLSIRFKNHKLFSQSYINGSSLILEDRKRYEFEFFTGDYSKVKNTLSNANFLIALCSDSDLVNINNSIFEGGYMLEEQVLEKKLKNVYSSNSYKLGSFILTPFRIMKRYLKR